LSNTTLQGWGRGTWGQGAWNEEIDVVVTGLVGTTALGTPDGIPGVNVAVTGVSATTAISQTGASTVTFAVTVVSGNPSNHPYYNQGSTNKYAIGGSTASADVNLTLYEGNTYRFDQSDSSNDGHPLRIYETADRTRGEYTTGVTTNGTPGQAGAYTEITVADNAPRLFYQCSNHAYMGATITTHGIPNIDATTGAPTSANTPVSIAMTSALGSNFSVVTTTEVTPSDYNNRLPALQTSLNDVVTVPQCVVSLTGLSATGSTGEELVYSLIVPNQTANWQEVA
jgi:hypothetical protein